MKAFLKDWLSMLVISIGVLSATFLIFATIFIGILMFIQVILT